MTTYYVPAGNWTNIVMSSLGYSSAGTYPFEVNVQNGGDPAGGCQKEFTATYQCGPSGPVKSLKIAKEANAQSVVFDCSTEVAKCKDLKLTLTDDAKLTLTNGDGSKTFWDSVSAFGTKGSIPLNSIVPADTTENIPDTAPLMVPDYAGNGTPNSSVDVGAGGGPGRRYRNNYLLAGQFLEYGQWIGSPKGTCRLMMGTPDDPTSLKVVKNILGCASLDAPVQTSATKTGGVKDLGCWNDTGNRALSGPPQRYGYNVDSCSQYATANGSDIFALQHGGWCTIMKPGDNYKKYGAASGSCPTLGGGWVNHVYSNSEMSMSDTNIDPNAARIYTAQANNETIGKVAYINNLGQLQMYPDQTMTTYINEYEKTGNYDMTKGAELGAAIKTADVDECKMNCNTGSGDTQKCAGFVFDTTTAMCQLLDNTVYSKNRIINPKREHYVRQKEVNNKDVSCPTPATPKKTEFWKDMVINSTDMTPDTKCGLANFTEKERIAVANKLPVVYDNLQYKDTNNNVSAIKYRDLSGNQPLLNKNKNGFKYWYETLQDKYATLTHNLFNTKEKIDTTFSELQDSRQNLADWTGAQLQNLEAMNEDRDLNMMSQNYRHIMWSILAILIIMTTMKITKSVAQTSS